MLLFFWIPSRNVKNKLGVVIKTLLQAGFLFF